MFFREAMKDEIIQLIKEGYQVWPKGRTYEQYYEDNAKEDAYGTRYVIDDGGHIVSSTIVLRLPNFKGYSAYGFGSVLTLKAYEGKGYATSLLQSCLRGMYDKDTVFFLYSEIAPAFYEKFGFRSLPSHLQKCADSTCMILCTDDIWDELQGISITAIPDHF